MFPSRVFRNRSTVLQLVNTTIHGVLLWMVLYFMSLYYLGVRGFTPFKTGIWALPATTTVVPMAMVVGYVVGKSGIYKWFLWVGWAMTIVVFGAMTKIDVSTPTWMLILVTTALGIAMGMLIPAMSVGIQATVPKEDVPYALSMVYILRAAGQCLGVAIGQGIFSGRLQTALSDMDLSPTAIREVMKTIGHTLSTGGLVDPRLLDAVVKSLSLIWIAGCALAALAGILMFFTRCPILPEDESRIREVDSTAPYNTINQQRHP